MNPYDAVLGLEFPPRFEIFCARHFNPLALPVRRRDPADVPAGAAAT
jgi:hypothetical protein